MYLFIKDITKDITPDNTCDVIDGVSFDGISDNWKQVVSYNIAHVGDKPTELVLLLNEANENKHSLKPYLFAKFFVECEGRHKVYIRERSFKYWYKNPVILGTYGPGDKFKVTFEFFSKTLPDKARGNANHFDFDFAWKEEK